MKPILKYEIPEDHPKVKAFAPLTEKLSDLVESYMPDGIDNTAIQTTISILKLHPSFADSVVYSEDVSILYTVCFSLYDIRQDRREFLAFNIFTGQYFNGSLPDHVSVEDIEDVILHRAKMLIYDAIHAIIPFAKGRELDVREDGSFHTE